MKRQVVNLVACACLLAPGIANAQIYKDSNGYFAVVAPSGWKQQDYPSETVRSKVAFNHPKLSGVDVRIIAGPTPESSYSLDDLLAENREKIQTVLKPKIPGGSFTVSKEKVGDREAVVQLNSMPGAEQKVVMFVNKSIWYSVALNASSRKEYESVRDAFQKCLNSFTILESGRKFSDGEMKAAVIAKYKRLAEIYEHNGDTVQALAWVKEGLEVDPDNKELLDTHTKLTQKHK
jgi:hypothetical protein